MQILWQMFEMRGGGGPLGPATPILPAPCGSQPLWLLPQNNFIGRYLCRPVFTVVAFWVCCLAASSNSLRITVEAAGETAQNSRSLVSCVSETSGQVFPFDSQKLRISAPGSCRGSHTSPTQPACSRSPNLAHCNHAEQTAAPTQSSAARGSGKKRSCCHTALCRCFLQQLATLVFHRNMHTYMNKKELKEEEKHSFTFLF